MTSAPGVDALDEDRDELLGIASSMEDAVPRLAERFELWRDFLAEGIKGAASPLAAEVVLEQATRALRHIWLQAAASSTSKSYRSPTEDQPNVTPCGQFHDFGYERELQPDGLERRCARFFASPPPGWSQDHVLFSSGQAAMTAVLTLLSSRQAYPLRLRHDGCYFETANLLELFTGRFECTSGAASDVVVAEPVWCDGRAFGTVPFDQLAREANSRAMRSIVVDSTLAGLDDGLNALLLGLRRDCEVLRIHSGLKLFQAGLELSDVGIVSIYGASSGDALRRIRTLQGAGLRFADVAALELPLFLDAAATRRYEDAVFMHCLVLANALRENPAFHVSYPCDGRPAPFVIVNLRDTSAYASLDERICHEAGRRGLVFDNGGSFGFRGHRFETVRPEGELPFLRVAMGRRAGPSLEGIVDLFRTLTL
jgi:hypothetical protein